MIAESRAPGDSRAVALSGLAFADIVPAEQLDRSAPGQAEIDDRSLHFPIKLPSGVDKDLFIGRDLSESPPFAIPAQTAVRLPGAAVLGPAFRDDEEWNMVYAISVPNRGKQGIFFGVLKLERLFETTVGRAHPGLDLWLTQNVPSFGPAVVESGDAGGLETILGTQTAGESALAGYQRRLTLGDARWELQWSLQPSYLGGVDYLPAGMAAVGGSILSLLVAALISFLVKRNALVSERVAERTAELSEARDRLEQSNKAKTNFLKITSHELRTPLNAIMGFAELLEPRQESEQERNYARFILNGGRHLLDLINDLLDVALAESGRLQLTEKVIDPAKMISEVVWTVSPLAKEEQITIVTDIEPDSPLIYADGARLEQAFKCLCLNALGALERGGEIRISLKEGSEDGSLRITVEDNGHGMSEEQIGRAKQLFETLDDPMIRNQGGLGIGLPLCLYLVGLHDGQLEISSELGKGTTATIALPKSRILAGVIRRDVLIEESVGKAHSSIPGHLG